VLNARTALHQPPGRLYSPVMTNGVVYCNRCGTQNSALAKFCANCGTPLGVDASSAPVVPGQELPLPQGPTAQAALYGATPAAPPAYTAPVIGIHYGGFWIRFVAAIIDGLLVSIVVWPVAGIIAVAIGVAGGAVRMPDIGVHLVRGIVIWVLLFLADWIYEATLESSSRQATVGKMVLGLKVTDEHGNRISFARASARFFSKILSRMTLLIGYIMAGFTERKQALHDMIAGTLVVRSLS
jgi:uncharacterized RDD family membrane protein YckC